MTPELSLRDAQYAILDRITLLDQENIPLSRALGRISAVSLKSTVPKPAFDQSTRDGYAVAAVPANGPANGLISFRLTGEAVAGDLDRLTVRRGEAVRIMTGAMLPVGTKRVVPFEVCREERGRVAMPAAACSEPCRFIRKRGSTMAAGRVLVPQGRSVRPDHLLALGENDYTALPVFRRPLVSVLCTGSELVAPGMRRTRRGQKISGNSLLLGGLLAECGAESLDQGTVRDRADDIAGALAACLAARPQIILTTGGMGPGKYDLLEHVVDRLGGIVIYRALQVRPGRATLFALLDNVPLFALPGPPPAVRLLFHELVAPALRKMQGRRRVYPRPLRARLTDTVQIKKRGRLNLKGAVLSLEKGILRARPAAATEAINGILLLPASSRRFAKDTAVTAHLVGWPAALL